jgi:hypothetical protein
VLDNGGCWLYELYNSKMLRNQALRGGETATTYGAQGSCANPSGPQWQRKAGLCFLPVEIVKVKWKYPLTGRPKRS